MPPKRRVEAAEDKKEVPPAEKTKKEKIKETVNHSEEVAHILEDYRQGLFKLLQIIAVKFDKMTDGLAETIIRDSLNEFDDRIMERKTSKQVIESLGSTDNMSSVNEKTPTVSPDQDATGGAAASVQFAGIVYSDRNGKNNMNGKKVQMVRWACWSPLSSTDPNNIGQICKLPAMYNCVKCVCICVSLMV